MLNVNGTADRNTTDYGPFLFARETLKILRAHVAQRATSSLFLYLPHQSVHEPLQAPAALVNQCAHIEDSQRQTFCGMLLALDQAVDQVTSEMRATGYWANTLFIFQVG
eukprot:COSAG01_NODE_5548_length_4191_cov_36.852151_4_plen_109_part_00